MHLSLHTTLTNPTVTAVVKTTLNSPTSAMKITGRLSARILNQSTLFLIRTGPYPVPLTIIHHRVRHIWCLTVDQWCISKCSIKLRTIAVTRQEVLTLISLTAQHCTIWSSSSSNNNNNRNSSSIIRATHHICPTWITIIREVRVTAIWIRMLLGTVVTTWITVRITAIITVTIIPYRKDHSLILLQTHRPSPRPSNRPCHTVVTFCNLNYHWFNCHRTVLNWDPFICSSYFDKFIPNLLYAILLIMIFF